MLDTTETVEVIRSPDAEIVAAVELARTAQRTWRETPLKDRQNIARRFAALVAHRSEELCQSIALSQRQSIETYTSELVPLADAAGYLAKRAAYWLSPRWESRRGRPLWAWHVAVETRRLPWGVVLIIGPSNYPLFLPGVQMLQALIAGNTVVLKPGRDSTAAAHALRMLWVEAGGSSSLVQILPEAVDSVRDAMAAGVDHVVLTGSTASGHAVMQLAEERLTPATLELSGCDAVFVLPSADIELTARAISFGLTFNGSATCIAPRRVYVDAARQGDLQQALLRAAAEWQPKPVEAGAAARARQVIEKSLAAGAQLVLGELPEDDLWSPVVLADVTPDMAIAREDLFAPVTSLLTCTSLTAALEAAQTCPYALGASVFGEAKEAAAFARQVSAGCVVVNDLIAPTADPRVSFTAWNQSGYGPTRGPEGLLQMTRVNVVVEQRGKWRPHLDPHGHPPLSLLQGLLNWSHGCTWLQRLQGLRQLITTAWNSRRNKAT
ncbi:aldehyde dehydrogenase family protein [bacterium]|nr:aldehyde dehydrogenase family protein [bacterium]